MGLLAVTAKNNVDTVLKNEKIHTYKINDGHPLIGCDEYVRGLYIDMLCVVAMYENEDNENQNRFIQRIMAGCNDKTLINEHIKNAMQLSVEKISEIIKQIKDNNLENIFYLESLIINCANGQPNKKQAHFLAELGEVLGFDKKKISFMCDLAVAVVEQNFEDLKPKALEYEEGAYICKNAACYVWDKSLFSTKKDLYYYSKSISEQPLFDESIELENLNSVVIENQTITTQLSFTSINKVTIINCNIRNINSICFYFAGVKTVEVKNCRFSDCYGGFSFDSRDTMLNIEDSEFNNFKNSYDYSGVIVCSKKGNQITIRNSIFRNLKACGLYPGVISYDNSVTSINCVYSNCLGYAMFRFGKFTGEKNTYTSCVRERN